MLSARLLVTIVVAAILLFVLELIRWLAERTIVRKFSTSFEVEIQFWAPLVVNLIFVVLVPAIIYASLYPILPFTSYRVGFFIALFVFGVGTLPVLARAYNQLKPPTGLAAFQLLWTLLTMLVVIGSITFTYHY